MSHLLRVVAGAVLLLGAATSRGGAALTVIARTGDTIDGQTVSFLSNPVINSSGQVAFSATQGMISNRSGVNAFVLSYHVTTIPNSPYTVIGGSMYLADNGDVAAEVRTSKVGGPLGNASGFLLAPLGGPLNMVMVEDEPAPAFMGAGVTFHNVLGGFSFAGGRLGFGTSLAGPGVTTSNDRALWVYGPSGFALLSRSGDAAPMLPGKVIAVDAFSPLLSVSGDAAFETSITPTDLGGSIYAMYKGADHGSLSLLASTNSAAPGANGNFGNFLVALNKAGHIATSSSVKNSAVPAGIWSDQSGSLQPVIMSGPAPGLSGVSLGSTIGGVISNSDHVAFEATLTGAGVTSSNDRAIYAETDGGFTLVARTGDPVPGLAGGAKYSSFLLTYPHPYFNARGQVVFYGGTTLGVGLFGFDPSSGVAPIAVKGTPIEVSPGIFRTPTDFTVINGEPDDGGLNHAFNEAGQFAFQARFSDGTSAIIVAQVPEPGLGLMAAAWATLLIGARRSRSPRLSQ